MPSTQDKSDKINNCIGLNSDTQDSSLRGSPSLEISNNHPPDSKPAPNSNTIGLEWRLVAQETKTLALLLISGDIAFLILHLAELTAFFASNELFKLGRDNGYAEAYQYTKFLWILLLLAQLMRTSRDAKFAPIIVAFCYLLADDSLRIHERFGFHIANHLNATPLLGLRPIDIGELAFLALAGSALLPGLIWAYTAKATYARGYLINMSLPFIILIFFGVFIDSLHSALRFIPGSQAALEIIEDGGEMFAVSMMVWYTFLSNLSHPQPPENLWNSILKKHSGPPAGH